jgi:hypothetical protein
LNLTALKKIGKGRHPRHTPGEMNGTERKYADELELRKIAGEIIGWWFEQVTFKLAKDTRYTPDFMVMYPDCRVEFHETKGFWQDDAKVKIKVAAQLLPFDFIALRPKPKKDGGGWEVEQF